MQQTTLFRPLSRRVAASFFFVVPILLGCATPGGGNPPGAAAPLTAASVAPTRGGVRYDPLPALNAEVIPRFKPENPPATGATYAVRYRGANDATVPAIMMLPAAKTEKAPAVVLLHGVGGKKEDVLLLAYAMARKGYVTLLIDIAGHGERPKIGGKQVFELSLPEMRQLGGQTVADLRRGIDFLATRPEVDAQRIGFVGISLGGILGGVFTADDPRVRASVLWAAGGDWGKLLTTSTHDYAQKYRKSGTPSADAVEKELGEIDPLPIAGNISPRPLLLINGDKDTVVPTICTDELFAAAREPKKRITLPGGHIPDLTTMATETLNFLDTHLKAAK